MAEDRPDKPEANFGHGSPGASDASRNFQEEQAIAAAMMIGEEMRRDDRAQTYFYTQRIALFVSVLAFMSMIMLYAYWRLKGGEFNLNLKLGLFFLGLLMAGGASISYWAHAESRRAKED